MSTAAADVARNLYERHAPQVYSLCLRRLGSREEAEDATQTVFLNAFGALQRGSRPRFERAWLWRIAENVCRDRRVRTRVARDLHALEHVLASPEREPSALAEIEQALAALPERQRRAILLREWHGLSYREIAAELGLSEAAAEALAFRARRTLADRLRVTRPNLSLVGWLKPTLGGSAAAAKVAAVVGVVAVGTGGAAAGYAFTREGSSPVTPARVVAEPAPNRVAEPWRGQARSAATPPRTRLLPVSRAASPNVEPAPPAPAPERIPPAWTSPPAVGDTAPASEPSTSSAPADAPVLHVEVPEVTELPVDVPELPVEVPPLPSAETPALPPVEAPTLPPLEPPALPDVPTLP